MAAAEATESRHAVRAGGLAAALLLAKSMAALDQGAALSGNLLLAWIWQDVAVALAFWLVDIGLRRSRWVWLLYAVLAAYVAINVAVAAELGTSLTPTMLRAAGGALGDSIRSALSTAVVLKMAAVLAVAAVAPLLFARLPRLVRLASVPLAALIVAGGAISARELDTAGLDRNAVTSLLTTAHPRIAATAPISNFRISPFGAPDGEDLTSYRGAAAGFNVLLVALESTGARYLASYGAADDPTPALTGLARESILFESAFAAYPESVKGIHAVLCANAPAIDVPAEAFARAHCDSLVARMSTAGYRTGLFHAGRFSYLGMQSVVDAQRFDTAEDAGAISGQIQSSFGVDEPAVVDRMLKWIDREPARQPFFAVYMPAAGHHPYHSTGAGGFPTDTDLDLYKNAIFDGDRGLALLLDGLRARKLFERTLVVVFGDHGQAFDQHPGNRVHSLYIYDENIHVPLVMRVPGGDRPSAAERVRRIASVLDIGPTILDLVGLPTQENVEGASLLPPRERLALFLADYDRGWFGLRDRCWKYLFEIESRRARLFDVCADPAETRDVAGQEQARIGVYRERVETWAAARRAMILGAEHSTNR